MFENSTKNCFRCKQEIGFGYDCTTSKFFPVDVDTGRPHHCPKPDFETKERNNPQTKLELYSVEKENLENNKMSPATVEVEL